MKNIIFLFSFIFFTSILFVSCETTAVEEVVDYTYSVSRVFWSEPVDNNADGYMTNRVLTVHVNLEEDVTRQIDVRMYFRPVGATAYSFYGSMNDIDFEGINSPLTVQFMVGPPLYRELLYGNYDFKVEIYESGSDKIEAKVDKDDTDIPGADLLGGQKFESLATDQIYSINVRWLDIADENENGYATQAALIVDVNIEQNLTKQVKVELYKKEQNEANYSLYETTSPFEIQFDSVEDSILFAIGVPPKELKYGTYNFKVVVYETGIYSPVAVLEPSSADQMADSLSNRKFETRIDDGYFYSIDTSNIFWTDLVDLNSNDTTSARKLNLNVNVDKNESRAIWAKIYYRESNEENYNFYTSVYENSPWQINGEEDDSDIMSITIGDITDTTKYLHKNGYDFLITIFEAGEPVAVTSVSATDSYQLQNQAFETASEDSL